MNQDGIAPSQRDLAQSGLKAGGVALDSGAANASDGGAE
jgi:hypothetical protein